MTYFAFFAYVHRYSRLVSCHFRELHEDKPMKAENWYPVAWVSIYDPDESKLPNQGYESGLRMRSNQDKETVSRLLEIFARAGN